MILRALDGLGPANLARATVPSTGERDKWRRLRRVPPPVWVLVAMMALYVAVFGTLTWRQQSRFGTFGFDMGIYDQGIWLLSRFRDPFVTVRGLAYFGHHMNPITVAFVPFYWLGAGPHFLYLVQTLWLAAGAIPVWLLARDKLESGWQALVPAGAYLLYPSLEWINWWHFHPDALIITPLLFAYWLSTRRRWGWFAVAAGVALLCKEDAALALGVLGLLVAWRERPSVGRFVGLGAALVAAVWFAIATRVVLPAANGVGAFYESFFPGFGDSGPEVAYNVLRHPSRTLDVATGADQVEYYRQLLGPVGLLALLSPAVLLIAGPQLLVNVVSGHDYTHNIRYHYSSIVIAAVFCATVEACKWWRGRLRRSFVLGLLAITAVMGNVLWSPSPMGREFDSGVWAQASPRQAVMQRAVERVPPSASVSATYYFVPHLTHRRLIYEWPNPWVVANWGVKGENPADPARVDWLVLDTGLLGEHMAVFERLTAPGGQFATVLDEAGIVVARRVRPARGSG